MVGADAAKANLAVIRDRVKIRADRDKVKDRVTKVRDKVRGKVKIRVVVRVAGKAGETAVAATMTMIKVNFDSAAHGFIIHISLLLLRETTCPLLIIYRTPLFLIRAVIPLLSGD
jgi:hypothetical protein